jgi:hypothetical protein
MSKVDSGETPRIGPNHLGLWSTTADKMGSNIDFSAESKVKR